MEAARACVSLLIEHPACLREDLRLVHRQASVEACLAQGRAIAMWQAACNDFRASRVQQEQTVMLTNI